MDEYVCSMVDGGCGSSTLKHGQSRLGSSGGALVFHVHSGEIGEDGCHHRSLLSDSVLVTSVENHRRMLYQRDNLYAHVTSQSRHDP